MFSWKSGQISFLIIIDILYLCKFVSIRLMCPYNLHIHHISILRRHILVRLNTSYLQRNTGSLWYNRNNRLLFHLMIRLLLLNRSTSISFNVYVRYFRYRFQIRWNERGLSGGNSNMRNEGLKKNSRPSLMVWLSKSYISKRDFLP